MDVVDIAGRTRADISREVAAGGRFVTFQYAYSVVIASFRGTTRVHYVPPDGIPFFPALWPTLFTLAFGWWGLPWGVVYTLETLAVNLTGGHDVTDEVMKQLSSQPGTLRPQ